MKLNKIPHIIYQFMTIQFRLLKILKKTCSNFNTFHILLIIQSPLISVFLYRHYRT